MRAGLPAALLPSFRHGLRMASFPLPPHCNRQETSFVEETMRLPVRNKEPDGYLNAMNVELVVKCHLEPTKRSV